jgi:hypothetical protein
MANPTRCGDNSSFGKMAAMLRRVFAIIAVLSAMVFAAFVGCGIRQRFANDVFDFNHWNPSTRNYTHVLLVWHGHNFVVHSESTTLSASDNPAIVLARVGPSNRRLVHIAYPPAAGGPAPLLWGDHYRSTPSMGINQRGLSDCWTLLFRLEVALVVFAVLPGIWGAMRLRRMIGRRARGFAVVADAGAGAVDKISPLRRTRLD